ncbi:hypothetical protein CO179_03985, partial [candidate division WWE3 bacterium CG_4_9_14_3_um_filter_39_7]
YMKFPKFRLPFRKKDVPFFIVIDVGSHSVKAGIYKRATEIATQKILGMGQQDQGADSMYGGFIRDLDAVIETTNLAIEEAVLQAGVKPKEAIIGLSGGVLHSEGFRVRTNRTEPNEMITEDEFSLIANHIEDQTLEHAEKSLLAHREGEFKRVETSFTQYKIDGARVITPIGVSGKQLEVSVLHYFSEESQTHIVNSLANQVDVEIVSLVDTSVQLAAITSIEKQQFVLIDVGGSVTSVVIVNDGKIERSEPLFMGGDDYVWAIQKLMNVHREGALSLFQGYTQGNLDDERARNVRRAIEDMSDWIVEGVATTLHSMKLTRVPATVIVAGEIRHVKEFTKAMSVYPWAGVPFAGTLDIQTIPGKTPHLDALAGLAEYVL